MIRALLAALAFLLLTSCGTVSVSDYAADKPPLDLKAYFNGKVDGWGTIQDRFSLGFSRVVAPLSAGDKRRDQADGSARAKSIVVSASSAPD